MNQKLLTIAQAAKILGVSIQTLRRWDESGKLPSNREAGRHRRYLKTDLEAYIRDNRKELDSFKMARNWAADVLAEEPISDFYCPDISVFQARLMKLEAELAKVLRLEKIFPLISAITGEIGNNSFDHNLGNWPDVRGVFFVWDAQKGKVALADRGQGIFATLRRVRPELKSHQDALWLAFTKMVSGRAPEYRGNGLKFVRNVVTANKIGLVFETGDARLEIKKRSSDINVQKSAVNFRGCLALISF